MKKLIGKLTVVVLAVVISVPGISVSAAGFGDVPPDHYAYAAVNGLRDLGVTDGIGDNRFGLGQPLTQSELAQWVTAVTGRAAEDFTGGNYQPDAPATREQAAVMMVNAAGFGTLAGKIAGWSNVFEDVENNTGHINIAKDFGIMSGVGGGRFSPEGTILREQAAAALFSLHKKLNTPVEELNAFYAIQSSGQKDFINELSSVCFGWSRIEYDSSNDSIILNTIKSADNEYGVPDGFSGVVSMAEKGGVKTLLMITAAEHDVDGVPLVQYVISPEARTGVISDIKTRVSGIAREGELASFGGVVVDLENIKGEANKKNLTAFITELRAALDKDKLLYVAVHPARRKPLEYFDAYDFRAIGEQADRVILMAHDYNAKSLTESEMQSGFTTTPLSPIDEVYYALLAMTDPVSGVADRNRIMLQISFDSAQWKVKDGVVTNAIPYRPDYTAIAGRIAFGAEENYSQALESPYLTFDTAEDGAKNIVWYEDTRSVEAKIKLAAMFGVNKLSFWRLGTIPSAPDMPKVLDVWGAVKN